MKLARITGLLFVPLALCAAVPQQVEVYEINENNNAEAIALMQEQQELADNILSLKMGLAIFFSEAHRVANEAIREQTELLEMENGPTDLSELLDIMFSTEAINRAQVNNASSTTVTNPLQGLLNGIGDAINGITGEVAGIVNNVTGGNVKNGTVSLNGTDPISGILNGVGGSVNDILGNVGNIVGSVIGAPPSKNGTSNVGLGGLLGGIANSTGALLGGIGNNTGALLGGIANGTGSILTGVTENAGALLSNLTNGLVNADVLNSVLDLVNSTLSGVLTGNLSVGNAINDIFESISQATGADNPLGKFLQNLANYLSNNQGGIIANVIKFSTFINAVAGAIAALITNSIGNVSSSVTKSISDVILGVIGRVLGVGLIHRTQELNADDFVIIQNIFLDSMRAVSPVTAAYAQQLVDCFGKIAQNVTTADPFVLSLLANPTEENIRRFINTIAKILNEYY